MSATEQIKMINGLVGRGEVARQKAAYCREIANAAYIHGEEERWNALAQEFEDSIEDEDLPGLPILQCLTCGTDLEVGQRVA